MENCYPSPVPIRKNAFEKSSPSASDSDVEHLKKIPYQQALGSVMYIFQATRPDLAYAVSTLSRFNNSYGEVHWNAVKGLLRYLQGTKHLKLCYSKSNETLLEGYCDASLSKNMDDPRSVAGYVFLAQGGAISWYSKRLTLSALSTVEAELVSISLAAQEAIWLRDLACELSLFKQDYQMQLYSDSQGAIHLVKNGSYSPKTKHIIPRYMFVKDVCLDQKVLNLEYRSTQVMVADMLTKAAETNVVKFCVNGMGLSETEK